MNLATLEMLSQGRTAEIFNWENNKVLKLFHSWCSPDWAESEANIADLAFKAGLPVPEVFETIELGDRQGIVFERIDGVSMLDSCIENPHHVEKYGRLLAEIHQEIHKMEMVSLPDLLPLLVKSTKDSMLLPAKQKQALVNVLRNQTDRCQLCHMDFHPDQVLITENGPRIIDWGTACQGNPLADVARTSLILRIGQIPRPTNVSNQDLDKLRSLLLSAYLDQYFSDPIREDTQTIAAWELVVAIARLAEKIDGEELQLKFIIQNKIEVCGEIESHKPA